MYYKYNYKYSCIIIMQRHYLRLPLIIETHFHSLIILNIASRCVVRERRLASVITSLITIGLISLG